MQQRDADHLQVQLGADARHSGRVALAAVAEVEVFTTQLHASPDVADHHLTHESLGRLQRLLLIKPQHVHDIDTLRLRSEEHTSELQSLMRISYAVFCLKNTYYNI